MEVQLRKNSLSVRNGVCKDMSTGYSRENWRGINRDTAEVLNFKAHGISQVSRHKAKWLQEEKLRLNAD